jgi:GT2 family glycosyltransferase
MTTTPPPTNPAATCELSVIIPARNEQANIATCLKSLLAQQSEIFALGRDWELIVVDDASTDDTRAIAQSFAGVTVLDASHPEKNSSGKSSALWFAAQRACGRWLLFTDADTIHQDGSLRHAIHEAEKHHAALLSYSPHQIVTGLAQRAVMPLIFADLARTYPPEKVNDPKSPIAAANGQFLMMARDAYFSIGGHAAVADVLLEDIALARLTKRRGKIVRFRYAPDAVSTRMYRTLPQLVEGWTKMLAALFPRPLILAAARLCDFILLLALPVLALYLTVPLQKIAVPLLWLRWLWRFYRYIARSQFNATDCTLAVLGLPFYAWLLWQSWFKANVLRTVSWKGRSYRQ